MCLQGPKSDTFIIFLDSSDTCVSDQQNQHLTINKFDKTFLKNMRTILKGANTLTEFDDVSTLT